MYLVICPKCNLGFFNKILTEKDIEDLYSDDNYFQSEWCWFGKPYQEVWRERKKEFEDKQLGWIKKLKVSGKVLDIGCGGGAIVKAFNDASYNAMGVDLNENLSEFGRSNLGVDIVNIDVIDEKSLKKFGQFDLLYMADFLEHINEPRIFLQSISNILRDDGLVVIDVPLFELNRFSSRVMYFYTKLRNKRIRFKAKPYHLIFFRPNSLVRLCSNAGYKVKTLKTWKENILKKDDYRKKSLRYNMSNWLDHILPKLFGKYFNDRAFIVLEKA